MKDTYTILYHDRGLGPAWSHLASESMHRSRVERMLFIDGPYAVRFVDDPNCALQQSPEAFDGLVTNLPIQMNMMRGVDPRQCSNEEICKRVYMSGSYILRQLRSRFAQTPIVVYTGAVSPQSRMHGFFHDLVKQNGADALVRKTDDIPKDLRELGYVLDELLLGHMVFQG